MAKWEQTMKALVVFDSTWGNTEQIAHAVAAGIGGGTKVLRVGAVEAKQFDAIDLLVLGSPILGGRPSLSMHGYINSIPEAIAKKLEVATFDTRLMMRFAKERRIRRIVLDDHLRAGNRKSDQV
jgi:menaquinone-dependent protoporphyrinogen IX oxidase